MKQALANIIMTFIYAAFGLLFLVILLMQGVVWFAKPFVMLWQQIRGK